MKTTQAVVNTGKKAVDRVLPTHELRARQRRKQQTLARTGTEPTPQAHPFKPGQNKTTTVPVLGSFFDQFPAQAPLHN